MTCLAAGSFFMQFRLYISCGDFLSFLFPVGPAKLLSFKLKQLYLASPSGRGA